MTIEQVLVGVAAFLAVIAWGALSARRTPRAAPAADDARDRWVPRIVSRSLAAGGVDDARQQRLFVAALGASGAVGVLGGWLAARHLDFDSYPLPLAAAMLASTAICVQVPLGWLASRIAARRVEILTNFAMMLDLLQVAVEGGMGLAAAWATVSDAFGRRGGALAVEMRRVDVQVGLGASWSAALHDAGARTGVSEFGALGALLTQAERFGTEVSRAIRVQCDAIRNEEVESMEERAHRASVKVVLPLVGLLLPATLLVTFVPLLVLAIGQISQATAD